jgi:hypothetical protein
LGLRCKYKDIFEFFSIISLKWNFFRLTKYTDQYEFILIRNPTRGAIWLEYIDLQLKQTTCDNILKN